jgi:hypothetical protein
MTAYRALVGLDYAGKRAEVGDIVSDVPPKSVGWLVSQGILEKADGKPEPAPEPTPAPEPSPTSKTRERQSPTKKGND